jgi:hypothetical protein
MNYEEIFRNVAERPGMFFTDETLSSYQAFIVGFDIAQGGAPLLGFREYTIVKSGTGNNLGFGGAHALICGETEREKINSFAELLQEFFNERKKIGLRPIMISYQRWLEKQSWYRPERDDYSRWPGG